MLTEVAVAGRGDAGEPVFDPSAVLDFLENDEGFLKELVGIFLTEAPKVRHRLSCISDSPAAISELHELSNSARAVGALRCAVAAKNLENKLGQENAWDPGMVCKQIIPLLDGACTALTQWLAGAGVTR